MEMFIEGLDVTLITLGLTQEDDIGGEVIGKVFEIEAISFPSFYIPGQHG